MMRPRISRFERRILVSLLLTGLVPFLVWLVLGLKLLLDAPLELPREARERFGTALFLYKSFIDAKKSEFSARADSIAKDPILRDAVERGAIDDARIRLEGLVADYSSIRRIKLTSPEGEKLLEVAGPEERMTDEFRPRTWLVPLGLGFAPKLYIVFLEPSDWRKKRDELQTFQEKYEAAVIDGQQRLSSTLERFAFVTAIVLLIALVIGFTIARGVTKRINRMAAATEDVAQGRLEIEIPVDLLILAMGFVGPDTSTLVDQLGVELTERGNVAVDHAFATNVDGVFGAGDAQRGQSLVVWAISDGREAARAVDSYLGSGRPTPLPSRGIDQPFGGR